jgi:hypothetical protein
MPTSDLIRSHGETQCETEFENTYTWCIYQFSQRPFIEAIGAEPDQFQKWRIVAGWLAARWKGKLSNLHRIFLVHIFLNPLERYSPSSRISPLMTTQHPKIFKGPSPLNLAYLADLEKAEIVGIYNAMKATYDCRKTTTRSNALGEIEAEEESMIL